jgi:hypothetical protein
MGMRLRVFLNAEEARTLVGLKATFIQVSDGCCSILLHQMTQLS